MVASAVKPVQERIVALDVLRGFALLGIFIVNMVDFSGSGLRLSSIGSRGSALDQLVEIGIVVFFVTKFYLIFSFLFGVGFAVQMRSAEAKGRSFVPLYLRRLLILGLIGLAHSILIWDGDILRLYAVAGVLLLFVRKLSTCVLLGMALALFVGGLLVIGITGSMQTRTDGAWAASVPLMMGGSYGELVQMRLANPYTPDIQTGMILVMFLLGMVVGRAGLLDDPARYTPFLRRWWKWALPAGLIGNGVLLYGFTTGDSWMISIGVHIGAPLLSFFYVSLVLLNTHRLGWLAPVGQMAMTNYLSQSLIGTTLFYGYGFGLYDQLAPTVTFALTFVIFALQVVVSATWMGKFRFGPIEWLWRSLTYWQAQPLARGA